MEFDGQEVQTSPLAEYFPASQRKQGPPPGPAVPGSHGHEVAEVAPAGHEVPAGEDEHGAEPTVDLYFAAGQVEHVPPSLPVKPALH